MVLVSGVGEDVEVCSGLRFALEGNFGPNRGNFFEETRPFGKLSAPHGYEGRSVPNLEPVVALKVWILDLNCEEQCF